MILGLVRFKKRSLPVALLAFLVVAIPVFGLFFIATAPSNAPDLVRYQIGEAKNRSVVLGGGLNLSNPSESNLLRNASFEPLSYRRSLIVSSGTPSTAHFIMLEQGTSEGMPDRFFVGAEANILRRTDGRLNLLKNTKVKEVRPNRLSAFHELAQPADKPADVSWQSFVAKGETLLCGGSRGYILNLRSVADVRLVQTGSTHDIIGLCVVDSGFLALDSEGRFFHSTDGQSWKSRDIGYGDRLNALYSKQNSKGEWQVLAVGPKGLVLFGNERHLVKQTVFSESDFTACTAQDKSFIAVGTGGIVIRASEEMNWSKMETGTARSHWTSVAAGSQEIFLAGEKGALAKINASGQFKVLSTQEITHISGRTYDPILDEKNTVSFAPDFERLISVAEGELILGDRRGLLYVSSDAGETWSALLTEQKMRRPHIFVSPGGIVLAAGVAGELDYAWGGVEIEFADGLESGSFQVGDRVELEQLADRPRDSKVISTEHVPVFEWYTNAAASFTREDPVALGGLASLRLNLNQTVNEMSGLYSGQNAPFSPPISEADAARSWLSKLLWPQTAAGQVKPRLSQVFSAEAEKQMTGTGAYLLEFSARASEKAAVTVSLSGLTLPKEYYERRLDDKWQRASFLIIIPPGSVDPSQKMRLDFEFSGSGTVDIDRIYFGEAESQTSLVRNIPKVMSGKASLLRLEQLPIGSVFYPSEYWLNGSGTSILSEQNREIRCLPADNLQASLQACHDMEAMPWLVIRPMVTEGELRHLMQFMFGPTSSRYGALRTAQGASGRFSDYFAQIYIEFTAEGEYPVNDPDKQAFVDWAIAVISSTPEYKQIRNQLVFVDGMQYESAVFMSNADYHAGAFKTDERIRHSNDVETQLTRFRAQLPRDPGRQLSLRSELCSNLELFSGKLRLADLASIYAGALHGDFAAVLLDHDHLDQSVNAEMLACLLGFSHDVAGLTRLEVNPIDVQSKQAQSGKPVYSVAFGDRNRVSILAANLGEDGVSCQLSGVDFTSAVVRSYDHDGKFLRSQVLSSGKATLTLLPGAVSLIDLKLPQDEK